MEILILIILQLRCRGLTSCDDVRLWRVGNTYKPIFNTRQTWELIRSRSEKVEWFKCLWFSGATPKYSVLSWIAAHNRLATGDRVIKWNLQTDAQCVLCKPPMETREHLFFSCPLSQEIWLNLTGKFPNCLFYRSMPSFVIPVKISCMNMSSRLLKPSGLGCMNLEYYFLGVFKHYYYSARYTPLPRSPQSVTN